MRITGVFLVVLPLLFATAWGDPVGEASAVADWDAWYDGDVQVRLQVAGGEGVVFAPDTSVQLEFEANQSAYYLVYAVDTSGRVHLLFPRFWEEEGWVPRGRSVTLRPSDFASQDNPWGTDGMVYVEVVASPAPFDWKAAGLQHSRSSCQWMIEGEPRKITGDPFLAFNDIHRALFPRWNHALFTVDYTWFYIRNHRDAPAYLGYAYERVVTSPPPRDLIPVRHGWEWDFGAWCARPMYRSYYIPGQHHVLRSESHSVTSTRYTGGTQASAHHDKDQTQVRTAQSVPEKEATVHRELR